ncbi:MAG: CHAT domain-containing protein, partial [Anaerolineae bacterium]|nr:CHAT domain-containing protein [Anaerolineae bacterium]
AGRVSQRQPRGSSTQQWGGVAEGLLKAELGAVVGMQFAVKDASAIAFVGAFYKALLSGLTVDEAVHAGRVVLGAGQQDVRGFGTPVLYLRDGDGLLLPELAALPEAPAQQAEVKQTTINNRTETGTIKIGSIDARYSKGMIIGNTGTVTQHFGDTINTGGGDYVKGNKSTINTDGGAYFGSGSTINASGDIVGRDKNTTNTTNVYNNYAAPTEEAEAAMSAEARPLVGLLDKYFDLNELEDVAFQLGIDWDNLRGEVKRTKARAIVQFCDTRDLIPRLKGIMRLARPNLSSQLS